MPLILDRDDDDGEEVRGAVEEKADAGEAEEKEDLWRLWNSMASHKIAAKKPAAPVEERKAEEPRRQYQTIRFGAQAPPASAPAPAQQRTDSQWLSGRPTAAAAPSAYAIDPQLAPSLSSAPPASTAAEVRAARPITRALAIHCANPNFHPELLDQRAREGLQGRGEVLA